MKRVIIRRSKSHHTGRRAAIAVGTLGAATVGIRRWRHKHQPENVEG